MDCLDGNAPAGTADMAESRRPGRRPPVVLSCLLGVATASAVLLSGLNALVQMIKLAIQLSYGGGLQ